ASCPASSRAPSRVRRSTAPCVSVFQSAGEVRTLRSRPPAWALANQRPSSCRESLYESTYDDSLFGWLVVGGWWLAPEFQPTTNPTPPPPSHYLEADCVCPCARRF